MASQFFNVETYGRKARPGRSSHATIRGVLAEASRSPGAARHVEEPKPPVLLYGALPADVVQEAEGVARKARDLLGRKLRADGAVLVVGIYS